MTVRNGTKTQGPQYNLSPNHPHTALVRLTRIGNQIVARLSPGTGLFFHTQGGIWVPQTAADQNTFHGSTNRSMTGLTAPQVRIGPYAGGGTEAGPNPAAAFDWVRVGPDEVACPSPDETAPATVAALDPPVPDGDNGWHRSPVTVVLSADDGPDGSGVDYTEYRIDSDSEGAWEVYNPLAPPVIASDGEHVLEYRSADNAGNVEEAGSLPVKLDATPPATTAALNPPPPASGSWDGPVAVTLDASDATSGVAATEYRLGGGAWIEYDELEPPVVAGAGEHSLAYLSVDVAGNVEVEQSIEIPIVGGPELDVAARPSIRRVGAKRRKTSFRLRVTNAGDGPAGAIRSCARPPRKRVRITGRACRTFPALAAGASVQRMVRGRIMRRARGRTTRIQFVVGGPSVPAVRTVARLVVKR